MELHCGTNLFAVHDGFLRFLYERSHFSLLLSLQFLRVCKDGFLHLVIQKYCNHVWWLENVKFNPIITSHFL